MRVSTIALLGGLLLTTQGWESCKAPEHKQLDLSTVKSDLPPASAQAAGHILQQYFRMKNAMTAGQSDSVALSAKAMQEAVTLLLRDSAAWHNITAAAPDSLVAAADTLQYQLSQILALSDPSCERQRLHFKPVSNAAYLLLQAAGISNVLIYRQYCPMALNEQGAYWMSLEPGIENPYFGDKMLTCGEITDTLR